MNKNSWSETKNWPVEVPTVPIDHHGNIPVWLQGKWIIVAVEDLRDTVPMPTMTEEDD